MNSHGCQVDSFADVDLIHAAYANCGLIELAARGEIELRFRVRDRAIRWWCSPCRLWLHVHVPNGRRAVRVCCDFHDGSQFYCPDSLAACDLYFKSNLADATFAVVPAQYREKLRAFGPYFPCRPTADRAMSTRIVGNGYSHLRDRWKHAGGRMARKPFRERLRGVWWRMGRVLQYRDRQVFSAYEHPPQSAKPNERPVLFFNPSCWPEVDERYAGWNAARAELIVGLRERLGSDFVGGFRRSELAETKYRQAIEDRQYSHHEYVRFVQQSPLAIYTNGLLGCFSWRFVENFAAGKGIISEPIPNRAGFPLDEAHGVWQLDTPAKMVDTICELWHSPDRSRQLCRNSWDTYERYLRPAAKMRLVLEQVMAHAGGAQPDLAAEARQS